MTPKRHKHPLPFLVTLAGCVFMLAWVDPANATEVTRQLAQKGFAISQLRKSEVAIVKDAHSNLKVFFKGVQSAPAYALHTALSFEPRYATSYHYIFPHYVKFSLQADILTWMKRE
jgi:hypothetical protein